MYSHLKKLKRKCTEKGFYEIWVVKKSTNKELIIKKHLKNGFSETVYIFIKIVLHITKPKG